MFIANRHSARLAQWPFRVDIPRLTLPPMCASPLRHGRIAMFGGEDLGRWLLGDCRKRLRRFRGNC
jgi:hypothetical protein